jgi:hypothetical protein
MPRIKNVAELKQQPIESNFMYDYNEMCDAQALRNQAAAHPIKSVMNNSITDIIKAGHKLAYGEAYESVNPDGTNEVKIAEMRKKAVLQVGEKGSIARYQAILEYFSTIYVSANNINEYKFYKIYCEVLLESLIEPELIDKVLHAQKQMLSRLGFMKSGKYGVNTTVLADIQFVEKMLKIKVKDEGFNFSGYCEYIKARYEYIERWKGFSEIGKRKEKEWNGYGYNEYILGDGLYRKGKDDNSEY